jgi:hypothetical protein
MNEANEGKPWKKVRAIKEAIVGKKRRRRGKEEKDDEEEEEEVKTIRIFVLYIALLIPDPR